MEILEVLCRRRSDTVENLASEFGVSKRTIKYDIEYLSLSYPVYTVQGNGGGIYITDGYKLGRKYLTETQSELLEKLSARLTGEELETMKGILQTFSEPKRGRS